MKKIIVALALMLGLGTVAVAQEVAQVKTEKSCCKKDKKSCCKAKGGACKSDMKKGDKMDACQGCGMSHEKCACKVEKK